MEKSRGIANVWRWLSVAVRNVLSLASLLVLGACFSSGPDQVETGTIITPAAGAEITIHGTIVAVGDSLTEGFGVEAEQTYPAQLERSLRAAGYTFAVVNAGSSGETSAGTLARIDWILRLQPDIVILAIGGNDGLRGIDPDNTRNNLEEIIDRLQTANVEIVLAGMKAPDNMGRDYTAKFEALFVNVAEQNDLLFMPFLLQEVAADPALNQRDGIHPTAEGYQIVVDNLLPFVVEAIARISQS